MPGAGSAPPCVSTDPPCLLPRAHSMPKRASPSESPRTPPGALPTACAAVSVDGGALGAHCFNAKTEFEQKAFAEYWQKQQRSVRAFADVITVRCRIPRAASAAALTAGGRLSGKRGARTLRMRSTSPRGTSASGRWKDRSGVPRSDFGVSRRRIRDPNRALWGFGLDLPAGAEEPAELRVISMSRWPPVNAARRAFGLGGA